ncbi:MAG: transglutaminase domain-containing protein [Bacteroidales bacterium]|nr:transglutaminase domain-containing protein [Bacteroidales bacterium]
MRITVIFLTALMLFPALFVNAQKRLPVIRANSDTVDIRDGNELKKNAWTINLKLRPDVYTTLGKNKDVTFYTDCDSITFRIKPGRSYDFIILLSGKDSAWTRITNMPPYLEILKHAAKYNTAEKSDVPKFTYQPMNDTNLIILRAGMKLDSIAGRGSEVSKIINLMHWIHCLIPHDGQHGNPSVKNAMSMIKVCKSDHRGLNCRGLATVLNECYLSMGFKSRFVTCMPKDSVFNDCHVINMVYSNDLGKWLWMDPTNDAYLMNEKGELLGIAEVRERIIKGKPLILNPDANWNRQTSTTKEDYLYNYMAKNLYRIECLVSSEYDAETSAAGKKLLYVELLPLDAYNQNPRKTEHTSTKSGTIFINYKTNNPDVFWVKPE